GEVEADLLDGGIDPGGDGTLDAVALVKHDAAPKLHQKFVLVLKDADIHKSGVCSSAMTSDDKAVRANRGATPFHRQFQNPVMAGSVIVGSIMVGSVMPPALGSGVTSGRSIDGSAAAKPSASAS